MSSSELETFFERALELVKSDKAKAELEELKNRKFTLADFMDALESASDEELERWERDFFSTTELTEFPPAEESPIPPARDGDNPPPSGDSSASGDNPGEEEPPTPPAVSTRPGRKKGNVYSWTVDEDGNVQELGLGRVYTGEDEPDQVELPPDDGGGDSSE